MNEVKSTGSKYVSALTERTSKEVGWNRAITTKKIVIKLTKD